jgi:putative transposase
MFVAYVYKLRPSPRQADTMERWLNLLRSQYNFRLAERIEAYEQVKAPKMGEYCDLQTGAIATPLTCSVSKGALHGEPWKFDKKTGLGKKRSAFEIQSADMPTLKQERPWYKQINAEVLIQMLRQLDTAFQNFFKEGRGYPVFKRRSRFKSFTYPPDTVKFHGSSVRLPGIGWCRFFQSRQFPDGFKPRSVTVRQKPNGWYISVRLQDDTVPEAPTPNQIETAVGVDMGLRKLMSLSTGETVPNPQFFAKVERRRRIRGRRVSRKVKSSNRRTKAYKQLAKLEHQVACQREDYQWKLAGKLVRRFDLIIFEALNIKSMKSRCKPKQDEETGKYLKNNQSAKRVLNRLISDASWGNLIQKVKILAEKSGVLVHEVNPHHTSQQCSQCGYTSPSNRDGEKFICERCDYAEDADVQASINILNRGLEQLNIKLDAVPGGTRKLGKSTPMELSPTLVGEPRNSQQLWLFDVDEFLKRNDSA